MTDPRPGSPAPGFHAITAPRGESLAPNTKCANHGAVAATRRCRYCLTAMCDTCAFAFPDGVFLCPRCATETPPEVTARKRTILTWAYVSASTATLTIAGMFGAAAAGIQLEELDGVIGLLMLISIAAAMVLSNLARTRGQKATFALRIALVWSWALAALLVIFMIIGLSRAKS
jgi:hypothetical protein